MSGIHSIVNYVGSVAHRILDPANDDKFVGTHKEDLIPITDQDTYDKDVFDEHIRVLASFGIPVWEEPEAQPEPAPVAAEPTSPTTTNLPSLTEDDFSTSSTDAAVTRALSSAEDKHAQDLDALRADYDRMLALRTEEISVLRSEYAEKSAAAQAAAEDKYNAAVEELRSEYEMMVRIKDERLSDLQADEGIALDAAQERHRHELDTLRAEYDARLRVKDDKVAAIHTEKAAAVAAAKKRHAAALDAVHADCERRLRMEEEMLAIVRSDNELEIKGLKEERDAAVHTLQTQLAEALEEKSRELTSDHDKQAHKLQRMKITHAYELEQLKKEHAAAMVDREKHWSHLLETAKKDAAHDAKQRAEEHERAMGRREKHWKHLLDQAKADAAKADEAHKKEHGKQLHKVEQLEHLVESLTAELHKALHDVIEARRKLQEANEATLKLKVEHAAAIQAMQAIHAAALEAKTAELNKQKARHAHQITRMKINHAHALEQLHAAHAATLAEVQHDHIAKLTALGTELSCAADARVAMIIKENETSMESLKASHVQEIQDTRASLLKIQKEEVDAARSTMTTMERIHREAIEHQQQLEDLRQEHNACEPKRLELEAQITAADERHSASLAELEATHGAELRRMKEQAQHLQEELVAAESQHALDIAELQEAQIAELEVSRMALDVAVEETRHEADALAEADERCKAHLASLSSLRSELESRNAVVIEAELSLQRAAEEFARVSKEFEAAQTEISEFRAQARPVTPVKNTRVFPSHPTPPETPRSNRASFMLPPSPTPGCLPSAPSPPVLQHRRTPSAPATTPSPEHHCRLDSISQKYHLPHLVHLPHSMHRCQKPEHSPAADHQDKERHDFFRRPSIMSGKRSLKRSMRSGVSESSGTHSGNGIFGSN
ncbi:hypothetical protein CALVIDRAFT_41021 [Calocera viscosa TUFC12733]|uniref:Uncharacterized protein n=1 Tax=Calocera viscosa (strain TUFC12733) TaxID=1330018 RepID=A0A167P2R0_CALVF|nr:hypothetical protein CALVIDRAFT_41021 [Calocera viscosa TUFC12733]